MPEPKTETWAVSHRVYDAQLLADTNWATIGCVQAARREGWKPVGEPQCKVLRRSDLVGEEDESLLGIVRAWVHVVRADV